MVKKRELMLMRCEEKQVCVCVCVSYLGRKKRDKQLMREPWGLHWEKGKQCQRNPCSLWYLEACLAETESWRLVRQALQDPVSK